MSTKTNPDATIDAVLGSDSAKVGQIARDTLAGLLSCTSRVQ